MGRVRPSAEVVNHHHEVATAGVQMEAAAAAEDLTAEMAGARVVAGQRLVGDLEVPAEVEVQTVLEAV